MKILISGVAGFIGSNLAKTFIALGHEVIGIDNFSISYDIKFKKSNLSEISSNNFSFFYQDLSLSHKDWKIPYDCDFIIHCAAQPGLSEGLHLGDYVSNNIVATYNIINFASCVKNLKFFINISTSSVYGLYAVCNENAKTSPVSDYGFTKLAGEQLVLNSINKGIFSGCSLRLYSVYGPKERPDKIIFKLINSCLFGSIVNLHHGSEQSIRSFTYVDDVSDALLSVMLNYEICNNQIFNIGSQSSYTVKQCIRNIEEITGVKASFNRIARRVGDQHKTSADITKAKAILGFDPKTSFCDGLEKQIRWQESMRSLM